MPKMAAMNKKGFTIVELLVSMLLTSIIMGAIYSVYRVQTHSAKVQENRLEAQEYARSVLDMMVREIRNTGYFPVTVTDINCVAGQGGIVSATATTFEFRVDADADGLCSNTVGTNERIIYTLSGNDITRTEGSGAAQLLTNGNVTVFALKYFTQAGAELTQPIAVANLANIQRVSISLTVQSKNPDAEFGGQLTVQMTSNADLRNRGLPS